MRRIPFVVPRARGNRIILGTNPGETPGNRSHWGSIPGRQGPNHRTCHPSYARFSRNLGNLLGLIRRASGGTGACNQRDIPAQARRPRTLRSQPSRCGRGPQLPGVAAPATPERAAGAGTAAAATPARPPATPLLAAVARPRCLPGSLCPLLPPRPLRVVTNGQALPRRGRRGRGAPPACPRPSHAGVAEHAQRDAPSCSSSITAMAHGIESARSCYTDQHRYETRNGWERKQRATPSSSRVCKSNDYNPCWYVFSPLF